MSHFNKGRKQKPEHVAKRMEAVRLAMKRPEVKAKMIGHECSTTTRAKIGTANSKRLKGRKLSATHRANMSKARKELWAKRKADKVFMEQWSLKQSKSHKGRFMGELGANWKGGGTQFARKGAAHEAWRSQVLIRDNYTCQICDQYGGDMHIDHIKPWAKYPELRFELTNGRTLCRPCHYWVTFKRKMPKGSRWGLVGIKDLS